MFRLEGSRTSGFQTNVVEVAISFERVDPAHVVSHFKNLGCLVVFDRKCLPLAIVQHLQAALYLETTALCCNFFGSGGVGGGNCAPGKAA